MGRSVYSVLQSNQNRYCGLSPFWGIIVCLICRSMVCVGGCYRTTFKNLPQDGNVVWEIRAGKKTRQIHILCEKIETTKTQTTKEQSIVVLFFFYAIAGPWPAHLWHWVENHSFFGQRSTYIYISTAWQRPQKTRRWFSLARCRVIHRY